MTRAGIKHAKTFQWSTAVEETAAVYRELL
jgi:hypothetical protein